MTQYPQAQTRISKLNSPDELADELLRHRARCAYGGWATEYVAHVNSAEAALLVIDYYPRTAMSFIQEIFVLQPYRNRGIGTKLLQFAEEQAKVLDSRVIELQVRPLDLMTDEGLLCEWYCSLGYRRVAGSPDRLQKTNAV